MIRSLKPKWNMLYPEEEKHKKMYGRRIRFNNDTIELNNLLKRLSKTKNAHSSPARKPWNYSAKNQFVVIKCRYSYNKKTHAMFLHQYLPQKNHEEIKEKPQVFGSDLKEYEKNMSAKHFRFIISPDVQHMPMEDYIKEVVSRMEKETGYTFLWQAAVHTNTPNIHAHLVLNGFDKNRKEVKFDKDFITRKMFTICSELATNIVGTRTKEQMNLKKNQWITSLRWTRFDEVIENRIKNNSIKIQNDFERKRMIFLEQNNLARFVEKDTFTIDENYKQILLATGRYNTFLKVRNERGFENLKLYNTEEGKITGKVIKVITKDDESIWNNALIIESDNKKYYVPMKKDISHNLIDKKVEIKGNEYSTISNDKVIQR